MSFAQPGWLVLLILIPILGIGAVFATRLRKRQWEVFVAPRLREALLKRGNPLPRWLSLFFLLVAATAMIIALARPRGEAGIRTEKTVGRNVLIALDLSRSMRVTDVKPDRLAQAKMVIYELLEAMPNERIGLIGFAGSSYVYAPLTIDHPAVRETVEQIDENWAPRGGSDLAAAIHLATETFKKTGQKNNALVILSDGEKHEGDLDAMIAEAEKSGVYILAVGVGTEDGGFVPNADFPNGQMVDKSGHPVVSRLQPDVMRKLAAETKGRFTVAGSGLDIPEMVKSVIKDLDAFEMKGRDRRVFTEFYQWLILPAILFIITSITLGTRWKGVKASLFIAGAFFLPSAAKAEDQPNIRGSMTLKRIQESLSAHYAEKLNLQELATRYHLAEAAEAYRSGDFRDARTAYTEALLSGNSDVRANAHIGIGNTLFQLGWLGLSGDPYPKKSAALPNLDHFDKIVKEVLAKLRESEAPEQGETNGYARIESLITNWTDAVRHFDSAMGSAPSVKVARQNRDLTMTYLKRLQELLEDQKQDTEQSMPQQQKGEPQKGEGDPSDGKPDDGEEGPDGEKKSGDKEGKDPKEKSGKDGEKPKGKDGEKPDDKNGDKPKGKDGKKDQKDSDSKNGEKDPNESPEDRARRILKENADSEKGPLTPGRREFAPPAEDW
ncbi:MAG: VWA domain-containing protein [Luteolibacter sp.]